MITPRTTRLLRAQDLTAFRGTVASLASAGSPFDARDRLIIVPTRAAGARLRTTLERTYCKTSGAIILPEFAVARELAWQLVSRAVPSLVEAPPEAREILMGVAGRSAADHGHPPPFRLRPGLIAEVLDFYDTLKRHRKDVATFERLALLRLEPGAEYDRGAERLVRQTRFLATTFRVFEELSRTQGLVDEHTLRETSISTPALRPWRHVVVTVGDVSRDDYGLCAADWDVLTRVPGLDSLDIVVTDRVLAGAWHERIHDILPGIEEIRIDGKRVHYPQLRVPVRPIQSSGAAHRRSNPKVWEARDREEEIADFARQVRALCREGSEAPLDRIALVVRQPLPYVYLTREVLRSANIPCQTFEALPLAGEPFAAALDLVFSAVRTNFSRTSAVALLSSPHFRWMWGNEVLTPTQIGAADRFLSERGQLGGVESLERLFQAASNARLSSRQDTPAPALGVLVAVASDLQSLRAELPMSAHLQTLLAFLDRYDNRNELDDGLRSRRLRARATILGILAALKENYGRLDQRPVDVDHVFSVVRRWIESHTFAPRTGEGGVHLVDAESARFGDFDHVWLAGIVDGEWPPRSRGNIFYSTSLLRDLGWSAEAERNDHARAAFVDLLTLPAETLTVSTFNLEEDTLVSPSSLIDELDGVPLVAAPMDRDPTHIFELEMLGRLTVVTDGMDPATAAAVANRLARVPGDDPRFRGQTGGHTVKAYSLSGLERYQDCPFKFFAHDVVRLPEVPEDEPFLSPRARGRFIHEVFQRFFEVWDGSGTRTITVDHIAEARDVFMHVAEPMLASLGESDAALERTRLFGSAIAMGIIDVVLGLEASRPEEVIERWLESSFESDFALGHPEGPRIPIRGIADRVDLLDGNRLRVIDYKTGYAPHPGRALQVPIYGLCAAELAERRDGRVWTVADAAYVAFTGKRALVPVIQAGEDPGPALGEARERLLAAVKGVEAGAFPPRPHDIMLCRSCAYPSVCRKDYVDG